MKVIGHRGAAGLAPENTIEAIEAGIKAGANAVEFDVRLTRDGQFILCHDSSLMRIAGDPQLVKDTTYPDIKKLLTFSHQPIPTLDEALAACGETTAIIEAKGAVWADALASSLKMHPTNSGICVIAFNHGELQAFHKLLPKVPCYALERQNAFKAIHFAAKEGLRGVDLNYWIINPFSYLYARFLKLEILTYTIDRPILMRYFRLFYPHVGITTNRPDILRRVVK